MLGDGMLARQASTGTDPTTTHELRWLRNDGNAIFTDGGPIAADGGPTLLLDSDADGDLDALVAVASMERPTEPRGCVAAGYDVQAGP